MKHGRWVSTHLHLSAAYLFVADEAAPLAARPGENTAVAWFPLAQIDEAHFGADDAYLYGKLAARAQARSAGFLLRLAQGNGEEVCIPIRMAARPRPNAALDMVRHQRFVSRRIHHKRRACDVCNAVFPCEHCIREPQRIVQNHGLLLCLTRIRRHIGLSLIHIYTYANKAAGIALFAFPFLYVCTDIWIAFSVIAIIAGIAAFEELIITLKCPDFVPDRKGLAIRSAGGRSGRQ